MKPSATWEADCCSATQEISILLWNPSDHYCVQSRPPTHYPGPGEFSLYHLIVFSNIRFNIIPNLHPGLYSGLPPSGFSTKTIYAVSFSCMLAICFAHLVPINIIISLILEVYKLWVPVNNDTPTVQGVSQRDLQWYSKCYSVASVTKTFTLKVK
jgi:hypothetical protein